MKKRDLIIGIFVIFAIILIAILLYINIEDKNIYTLNLPILDDISSISISQNETDVEFNNQSDIKQILDILTSDSRTTTTNSVQDFPVNAVDVITINFYHKIGGSSTIFVYKRNERNYLEQPYNGIYQISEDEYNYIINLIKSTSINLEYYYNDEITKDYTQIKELKENYTIEEAISDNCFVINHARVYNENLYEDFMTKYENKESSFLRLVQPTTEGDVIIFDIKYDSETDKILLVSDSTRDEFAANNDKIISLQEYEKIDTYKYRENLFLVVYNGQINDNKFETNDNLRILCVVN